MLTRSCKSELFKIYSVRQSLSSAKVSRMQGSYTILRYIIVYLITALADLERSLIDSIYKVPFSASLENLSAAMFCSFRTFCSRVSYTEKLIRLEANQKYYLSAP